ncbi:AAA family ATPase [Raoultella ornithinolytica]|uniref:AAA family ATPase n=1 Tax=Raoultella ornithinolytica TaxID=54291 RepID=UPI00135D46CD|nr:AAA family ATPase [Raoultella ornithinolytica]MCF6631355.1 AAA family ATPase [Raoultella ornithinolytica]MCF6646613.1 AAA family ATPase [Raoultella ornithinolytica]MCF6651719.1 AAA family ATPase [Raoultella ornithinolytica]MCF6667239.1 AAA family ATPase [Raoultella ornithinolytica]MCF6681743.1 AAA family ATPase [Raoultella ornithinolytica]
MKVDKLHIRSRFKNLENVTVDFDQDHLMTVIVGRNGSGKSNVLEALVSIFRNLDLGEAPPFSYELVYRLGEPHSIDQPSDRWLEVIIDADPTRGTLAKQYEVCVRDLLSGETPADMFAEKLQGITIPFSKVKRDKEGSAPYLPKYVFAYYSGPSDRLERYFRKHRTDFYRSLLKNELDLKGDIRPLFYAKPHHSQFVLLAFFLSEQDSKEKAFLREHLGIDGLDSIHFVMRQPGWAKEKGELFWGARGVVRRFLDELIKYTLSPVKITRQEDTSLTGSNIRNEFFHLFLPDQYALRDFARDLSADELFKMLESTLLSEIISEVSIRVKVSSSEEPLTFRELSEGEQQLLTVLGLLKFTGGKDSLFLLDEPDTHLNPSWAVKYLKFLREFVPNHETSHLLMVTHHPLAIAELKKQQVQVMWRDDDYKVHSQEPYIDPRGAGFMATLTEIFGLNTTLDLETQSLLDQRNELAHIENRSEDENNQLDIINDHLNRLGFSFENRDPLYSDFLLAWQDLRYSDKPLLTPDKAAQRRLAMKKVIEAILTKKDES